jgi:RNA polymerase sigma factor (TIGR02999 family)
MSAPTDVTLLVQRWGEGDREALDRLVPLVYERLREMAHQRLRAEPHHTLNTTGLVHEAYLRLVETPGTSLRDRSHFLALASRVMRNLLVDHARARKAAKRGGGAVPLELSDELWMPDEEAEAVRDLDEALTRLERVEPRQARILEQRYFGGLSLEETAEALGVSLATVKRELRAAREWLEKELRGGAGR